MSRVTFHFHGAVDFFLPTHLFKTDFWCGKTQSPSIVQVMMSEISYLGTVWETHQHKSRAFLIHLFFSFTLH